MTQELQIKAGQTSSRKSASQRFGADDVREEYRYFRPRILIWTTIGYGVFYFVRKNFSAALPLMIDQLHFSKADMGLILSLHGVVYGVSKFLNGVLCDRTDARKFMAAGLIGSAIANVIFGFSSAFAVLAALWIVNGWFQGIGYPPCARLLSHWFGRRELATKMAIWNASHNLGSVGIMALGALLVWIHAGWRAIFFVPAAIAVATAWGLLTQLRDTPESHGLPAVEEIEEGDMAVTGGELHAVSAPEAQARVPVLAYALRQGGPSSYAAFLRRQVFSNPFIWIVSIANFFVYTLRYAIFDWGTTLLKDTKGIKIEHGALMIAGFELAGFIGAMVTGWLTDRVFRGRAAPVCVACMILAGLDVWAFWQWSGQSMWLNTLLLVSAGFFIYGPQALVAVIVVKLATKRAAATAVGLTSIFGYASTTLSGWGSGKLADQMGWPMVFKCLIATAGVGALLFAMALPAKAHGDLAEELNGETAGRVRV